MITEYTCIDLERIGEYDPPSVSSVLSESLDEPTLEQKLVLMEAVTYTLRDGGRFCDNLRAVLIGSIVEMPCGIYTNAGISVNEGLALMGKLHSAIVEDYSVLAANERLAG
jgi:hypothetical protein